MAKIKVVVHEDGIADFLNKNKGVRDMLVASAQDVAKEAQATADSAQEGTGGRITGYAEAGFEVQWEQRSGSRPRVNVVSKADTQTFLAAHFHTMKRDGVAHLRKALYSITRKG
jgi:hypothetical protein